MIFWGVDAAPKLATVAEAGGAVVIWPYEPERRSFKEVPAVVHAVKKEAGASIIVCSNATWKAGGPALAEAIGKLAAPGNDSGGRKVRVFDTDWILRTINRKHTEPLLSRRLAGAGGGTASVVPRGVH